MRIICHITCVLLHENLTLWGQSESYYYIICTVFLSQVIYFIPLILMPAFQTLTQQTKISATRNYRIFYITKLWRLSYYRHCK